MLLNSKMAQKQNFMPTPLIRSCILSVTIIVTYMSCLIVLTISVKAQLPFVMQIIQWGKHMYVYSCSNPLLYGNSVFYRRIYIPLEESYRTSRSCIHLRRLNILCLKVLNVNLHLTGRFHLSWKSVIALSLLSNRWARAISNATRSMELICPKR